MQSHEYQLTKQSMEKNKKSNISRQKLKFVVTWIEKYKTNQKKENKARGYKKSKLKYSVTSIPTKQNNKKSLKNNSNRKFV